MGVQSSTPSSYQRTIADFLARHRGRLAAGLADTDPRHVEAYMRLDYGTLDDLTPDEFLGAVVFSVSEIAMAAPGAAEALAQSFGLMAPEVPAVCAWCKRVRSGGVWEVAEVPAGDVTHGICDGCRAQFFPKKGGA